MPPYYDVHKGATDPKTTAEKHCSNSDHPQGHVTQYSHYRQLLLELTSDCVSLSKYSF